MNKGNEREIIEAVAMTEDDASFFNMPSLDDRLARIEVQMDRMAKDYESLMTRFRELEKSYWKSVGGFGVLVVVAQIAINKLL